jgi:hypothetical protein
MKNTFMTVLGILILSSVAFLLLKFQADNLGQLHGAEKTTLLYRIDSLKGEIFLQKMSPSLEEAKTLNDLSGIAYFFVYGYGDQDEKFELFFRRSFLPNIHPFFLKNFSNKAEAFLEKECSVAKGEEEWKKVRATYDSLMQMGFAPRR